MTRPVTGNVVKRTAIRTAGDAPNMKAILAGLLPAVSTLILAILNETVTVHASTSLKVAIVGLVGAIFAAVGAYLGAPGAVLIEQRDTP